MDDEDGDLRAPTELEMILRRNMTRCRCQHSFLTHEVTMQDLSCSECKCDEFREMLVDNA